MGKIPDELRKTIAKNIRESRMRKYPGRGGSKRCAEEFGVSPQQWSPWERGRRTPDETRLFNIATHLGVTVEYLRRDNTSRKIDFQAGGAGQDAVIGESASGVAKSGPGCPFFRPPAPGQPEGAEARSPCWLAERFFNEIKNNGIPIRLSAEDLDYLAGRIFQPAMRE